MKDQERRPTRNVVLAGIVLLLVGMMVFAAVTTYKFSQQAELAVREKDEADQKLAAAVRREQQTLQQAKQMQQLYAAENFKVQFLQHMIGATTLTEAELRLIRPAIGADDVLGPVLHRFDKDMQQANKTLRSSVAVANYQHAVEALLSTLKP